MSIWDIPKNENAALPIPPPPPSLAIFCGILEVKQRNQVCLTMNEFLRIRLSYNTEMCSAIQTVHDV